jgi:hypothetical protein
MHTQSRADALGGRRFISCRKKRKLDSGSVGNGSEKKKKKEKATEEKRPKRTADDGPQSAGKAKPKKVSLAETLALI